MKFAFGIAVAALVAGTAVVVVASKSGAQEQAQKGMVIVPRQSVGPVVNGMTTNEVEAILGKPDKWRGTTMVYESRYGISVTQSSGGAMAVLCGDQKFGYGLTKLNDQNLGFPGVTKFNGHTKEGIGIGSSKDDLLRALGPASSYSSISCT